MSCKRVVDHAAAAAREAHLSARVGRRRLAATLLSLLLALCPACSVLPVIAPELSRQAGPPVPLTGPQGPLSARRSQTTLDALARHGPDTGIFDRHLAAEEALVDSPLTTGNRVQLLKDGPATYRGMLDAIGTARHHVHMETYILDDDDVGRRFAQALIDKRRHGVAVRLIRDSVGTLGTPQAFFQRLVDHGVQVLEFNPVNPLAGTAGWSPNQRDHRKLLIVDGRSAFLGGINISSVYSGGSASRGMRARAPGQPAWRDTDLLLQGPVVAELQRLFLAVWARQGGPGLEDAQHFPPPEHAGVQVVRAIGSSPLQPFSLMYATLLSAIASAETSVHLTDAYFVPDPSC